MISFLWFTGYVLSIKKCIFKKDFVTDRGFNHVGRNQLKPENALAEVFHQYTFASEPARLAAHRTATRSEASGGHLKYRRDV